MYSNVYPRRNDPRRRGTLLQSLSISIYTGLFFLITHLFVVRGADFATIFRRWIRTAFPPSQVMVAKAKY